MKWLDMKITIMDILRTNFNGEITAMENLTTAQLVEILQHSHIPEEVEYALDILADRLPDVYKYY